MTALAAPKFASRNGLECFALYVLHLIVYRC